MRIFLSEYLTGGATGQEDGLAALKTEGAAMLRALATDAAAVPGWKIVTTWDDSLPPFGVEDVEVRLVRSPAEERRLFERLAMECDRTLVIAPESDGLLEARCRLVSDCGGCFVGATAAAIALCGDKLALSRHLQQHGVPTIPAKPCRFDELARDLTASGPPPAFVVKPRHGAGSVDTFRVMNRDDFAAAATAFATADDEPIVQPFVPGVPLSITAIVTAERVELFPVCRQRITGTTPLHYAGGSVPTAVGDRDAIFDLARRTLEAVPGLSGYVGIDLIASEDLAGPVVVEINPRLTSSYHGYRRLAETNLAERILTPEIPREPLRWREGHVEFDIEGREHRNRGDSESSRDRVAPVE